MKLKIKTEICEKDLISTLIKHFQACAVFNAGLRTEEEIKNFIYSQFKLNVDLHYEALEAAKKSF